MRNFKLEIDELITGKRESIEINRDEFTAFRQEWLKLPQRNDLVGEAHFGGRVVYRYQPDHDENE